MRISLLLSCVCVAVVSTAFGANAPRPNVLLICVDDLKPLLGCYGDSVVKSPHIDRLAASGMLFARAYTNQAVCAPSRNALMTGLRSTTLGIYDLPTNFRTAAPDAVTVAQYFTQHGWRAESLGKIMHQGHGNREDAASWSVPHWRPSAGLYASNVETTSKQPVAAKGGTTKKGTTSKKSAAASEPRGPAVENRDVPDTAYADGQIAEEAVNRLRAAKGKPSEPFFLAVGFLKPHLPFTAPKKYWDLYERSAFALPTLTSAPAGAPAYAPTTWGELRNYRDMPATGPLNADQQRELIHGYHAAVSFMDAQVGKVLDALDQLELAKTTIVVLWGDHGFHLGDHGQWCKHTNYEEATRIPFVIRAPGVTPPGSRTQALVESVDLYPTLAELAGLAAPSKPRSLDGKSLVTVLRDPSRSVRTAAFHAYPRNRPGDGQIIGRALRTDRYRLVEWKKPGAPAASAELELYDYVDDPAESKNVAAEKPDIVAGLRAELAKHPEAQPQVRK